MNEHFRNYTPPIADKLKMQYEEALASEQRWENGLLITLRPENDLEHVAEGFGIFGRMQYTHPNLAGSVMKQEVLDMWYLHDGGEILAHDLTHSHPEYDLLRPKIKRKERAAIRLLTRGYIEDPVLRDYIRGLYARYENPAPTDREAHMAHLIDKIQAQRFGLEFVFNGRKMSKAQRMQQLNHNFELIIPPVRALMAAIEPPAQEELRDFIGDEMKQFVKHGYWKNEVGYYIQQAEELLVHE